MGKPRVAAFTDTYLPTINGVTYTVQTWRNRWERAGGEMQVVYPGSSHSPGAGEYPVPSVRLPMYDRFRVGLPQLPKAIEDAELVHAHTPFGLGLAGARLSRRQNVPLVASYHTQTPEYAGYLAERSGLRRGVRKLAGAYESWFLDRADQVIVPSKYAAEGLDISQDRLTVISNGVDIDRFQAAAEQRVETVRKRLGVTHPVVGYTGRHGHEKELDTLIDAVSGLSNVSVVIAGDGPARETLERRAAELGVEAVFPGFMDREDLPAFYSLLDVFVFPSPVETEGIVALESIACGTPVVGADAGALPETITPGETGFTAPPRDTIAFRAAIERALDDCGLHEACLSRRERLSVDHSITALESVYRSLLS